MMYEIDTAAAVFAPASYGGRRGGGSSSAYSYRDETHNNNSRSAATTPGDMSRSGSRSLGRQRHQHHRPPIDDDEIVQLPPSMRRIFIAGAAAFLGLVLLAASTMSVDADIMVGGRGGGGGLGGGGYPADPKGGGDSLALSHSHSPPGLRQRDEQEDEDEDAAKTFAASVLTLMQDSVEQLVQVVLEAAEEEDDEDDDGATTASPSSPTEAPIVKKTASPTTTSPVDPPVAAPTPTSDPGSSSGSPPPTTAPGTDEGGGGGIITEGTANGVAYYSCRATSSVEKTILLFHGASLTKEQWKTSGILDSLCAQPTVTTYAFDLSVSSNADDLKALMDAMLQSQLIMSLPVNAIVTPSASGAMVVDWGERTAESEASFAPMSGYWSLWVPVASPAVAYVDPKSLLSSMFPNVEILAVHGDEDTSGGRVMGLLETYAGAKLVTIDGGHACYMQSPDDFVQAVLAEVL